ncbi:MAG: ethanolamine utilization protein EutJ [Eubacteriales bacterium]|jgi:ethanolamine utilization protein EutJ|nr:ethanolamine utilization protein EutJ [Eubacteriales bacterium]
MSEENNEFAYCDEFVKEFTDVIENPVKGHSSVYYTGVDLGTACVVMAVLDENYRPVAGRYQYADVVRDGMVVDYVGAVRMVRKMKEEIEEELDTELLYAAAAIPPGTDTLDGGAVANVVRGAGFEITSLLDEPTAANMLLKMQNGAVVDIGGGTTGISVIKDGQVEYTFDEATGGTHLSLVIAGAYKKPFEEAELFKRDEKNHQELYPIVKPVFQKMASIISNGIQGYDVHNLVLVGGTSCFTGIEKEIQKSTGIPTHKPANPFFVTPLGIALSCTDEPID